MSDKECDCCKCADDVAGSIGCTIMFVAMLCFVYAMANLIAGCDGERLRHRPAQNLEAMGDA